MSTILRVDKEKAYLSEIKGIFPKIAGERELFLRGLLSVLVVVFYTTSWVLAAPVTDTINLSGMAFPCQNCSLTKDGTYRLFLEGEEFLLRPYEARTKLFQTSPAAKLAQLNKPGDILRFLLGQDAHLKEAERTLETLLATDGGRSTLILSFESIYNSHANAVMNLLMRGAYPADVLDGIRNSPVTEKDNLFRITLFTLSSPAEGLKGLYQTVEDALDPDLSKTLEKVEELQRELSGPVTTPVLSNILPELEEIKDALSKTSDLLSSAYSEAGMKPELRRIMRKQRLLTSTEKALAAKEEDAEQVLRELNDAYDPSLDTPLIHEAFRHLISLVPNASEILGANKEILSERDPLVQLLLNPPPTLELSFLVVTGSICLFLIFGIYALLSWRKRWKMQQRIVLSEGLSFEERRELHGILAQFGLTADTSLAELQSAFRRLAKQSHPDADRNGESSDTFIKLQENYARAKELISAFRR